MLRSYAQGDDYVLGQANAPGQAAAVNLSTTNTTCAGNVATTIIARDNMPDGTRGIVALQGKPQLPVPAGMTTEHWAYPLMFVRVPTPTYEFVVGTGAAATPRRVVADTKECLGCHVGSLYQHGNTRVDNVTMCIICHNSASSEQNIRVAMGVDSVRSVRRQGGPDVRVQDHAARYPLGWRQAWPRTSSIGPAASMPGRPKGRRCRTGPLGRRLAAAQSTRRLRAHDWLPRLRGGSCGDVVVPDAQPVPPDVSAGSEAVLGVPCRRLRHDPRPGEGRGDHDRRRQDRLGHGHGRRVEEPARRYAAGRIGGRLHELPPTTDARGHAYQNGWTPQTFQNGRQTILDTK